MQKRLPGQLDVSAMGLGCMRMSSGHGPAPDHQEMFALLRGAVERGVTFFDPAQVYGPSTNEEVVGKGLAPARDKVVLATKFGFSADAHGSDQRGLPLSGQAWHFRLSETGVNTVRKAHAVQPVTAVESEYSIWWRRPEEELLPVLEELGIGMVPYGPLGRGFLTGTMTAEKVIPEGDVRGTFLACSRSRERPIGAGGGLTEQLCRGVERHCVANRSGVAPRTEAMDRTDSRNDPFSRVEQNNGSVELKLTPNDLGQIDQMLASVQILGDRYPEEIERQTNV